MIENNRALSLPTSGISGRAIMGPGSKHAGADRATRAMRPTQLLETLMPAASSSTATVDNFVGNPVRDAVEA
jgi:hypothetical protein